MFIGGIFLSNFFLEIYLPSELLPALNPIASHAYFSFTINPFMPHIAFSQRITGH